MLQVFSKSQADLDHHPSKKNAEAITKADQENSASVEEFHGLQLLREFNCAEHFAKIGSDNRSGNAKQVMDEVNDVSLNEELESF